MEAPSAIQNAFIKTLAIEKEGKKFILKIQIFGNLIEAIIFSDNLSIYKGNINLEKLETQISLFSDFNLNEIYEEIKSFDSSNFSVIKESQKYKLKIKFIFFKKEKYLFIDLEENKNINLTNSDLVNYYDNIIKQKDDIISELKGIIRLKDEKIKSLEELLNINNKNNKIIK